VQDEQWKVNNCKICPQCNRAISRLSGCDTMVCGQDAHGGNKQNGCGITFNWSQAGPYVSNTSHFGKKEEFNLQLPKAPTYFDHKNNCSQCGKNIVGLLFRCIYCQDFFLCEECDRGVYLHLEDHIFDIK